MTIWSQKGHLSAGFLLALFLYGNFTPVSSRANELVSESLSSQLFDKFTSSIQFKELENFLSSEDFAFEAAIEALEDFKDGKLHLFDPAVGDSSCQVRAHQMLKLAHDQGFVHSEVPQLLQQLKELREKIKSLKMQAKDPKGKAEIKKLFVKGLNMHGLARALDLAYPALSPKAEQLILSHFTTKYNSENEELVPLKKELLRTSYNGLSLDGEKSNKAMNVFLEAARIKLSTCTDMHLEDTIDSVYEKVCEEKDKTVIKDGTWESLEGLFEILKQVEVNGPFRSRSTYAGLNYLLVDLWHQNVPILLKSTIICPVHGLHKLDIVRMKGELPYDFVTFEGDMKGLAERPMVVLEGVSDLSGEHGNLPSGVLGKRMEGIWKERGEFAPLENCTMALELRDKLKELPISTIIKLNSSRHHQFVDKSKNIDFSHLENPKAMELEKKFQDYCNVAVEKGLCMENMSTLRLIHIFPAMGKDAFGKVKLERDQEMFKKLSAPEEPNLKRRKSVK